MHNVFVIKLILEAITITQLLLFCLFVCLFLLHSKHTACLLQCAECNVI